MPGPEHGDPDLGVQVQVQQKSSGPDLDRTSDSLSDSTLDRGSSLGAVKSNLSSPCQAQKLNMSHSPILQRISCGFTRLCLNYHLYPTSLCQLLFIATTRGAIQLSKDSTFHRWTKHINIHFHFIKQTIFLWTYYPQILPHGRNDSWHCIHKITMTRQIQEISRLTWLVLVPS